MARNYVFLLSLLAVSLLTAACSPTVSHQKLLQQGFMQSEEAISRFGEVRDGQSQNFLRYLQGRLDTALRRATVPAEAPFRRIVLLNSPNVLAFSAGDNFILISKGLVARTHTEAELAFVLAHEYGHQILGHNAKLQSEGDLLKRAEMQRGFELEADKYGIGLMALAGYDPRAAFGALRGAYTIDPGGELPVANYPDLRERLAAIEEQLRASGWMPPGTVDRREFQKFRKGLFEG